jgi:hypothetical protein
MREIIFKDCDQIDTTHINQINDCSSLYLSCGDVDGDGIDEVVICNLSGPIAIIKESTVYRIRQLNLDSVCSLNVCPVYGNFQSEIITISLTGVCTIYSYENSNKEGLSHVSDTQKSTPEIVLNVILKQPGVKKNSIASKVFRNYYDDRSFLAIGDRESITMYLFDQGSKLFVEKYCLPVEAPIFSIDSSLMGDLLFIGLKTGQVLVFHMTLLRYREEKSRTCNFPSPTAFVFGDSSLKGDSIFDILENVYSVHNEDQFHSHSIEQLRNKNDKEFSSNSEDFYEKLDLTKNDSIMDIIGSTAVLNDGISDMNSSDVSSNTTNDVKDISTLISEEISSTLDYDQSLSGEENTEISNEHSNNKNKQEVKTNNSIDHKTFHVEWYTTRNSFDQSDLTKEGNHYFNPQVYIYIYICIYMYIYIYMYIDRHIHT